MKPKKKLPSYVYQCLEEYGNTVLNYQKFKQLGEEAVLNDLLANGFNCRIKNVEESMHSTFKKKNVKTIVIERIE